MDYSRDKALTAVDGEELVRLTSDLIDIPTPVGAEEPAAKYLAERFRAAGLETTLQPIEPGRANVVGRLRGNGGGRHLLYVGHLDTTWSGSEEGIRDLGPGFQPLADRDGDWIRGMGAYNMKSGLASMVHAVESVAAADPDGLRSDLIIAGVAGETCHCQVGNYVGPRYRGTGLGAQFLTHNGVTADLAVIAEPTSGLIDVATGGLMLFEVVSRSAPQATYQRLTDLDAVRAPDALEKSRAICEAVEAWTPGFVDRNRYEGVPLAGVNLLSIEGGHPWRPSKTAVHCRTYFEINIMPGMRQVDIEREFRDVIDGVTVRGEAAAETISLVHNVPGAESGTDTATVDALKAAHERVHGKSTEAVTEAWYCDSTPLTRNGIPTLIYGPGGRSISGESNKYATEGESCYIPDLVQGSNVFIEFAYDFCG